MRPSSDIGPAAVRVSTESGSSFLFWGAPRRFAAALAVSLAAGGCVVSTYGGPGVEPVIATPPRDEPLGEAPLEGGPAEIGARHILISYKGATRAAPYVTRSKDEARQFAEALRKEIQDGADFTDVAKRESDDRGSAATGGALGKFSRDQMVPEFSNAAFALDVGGLSNVVESQFGFHVIQRTE